MVTASSPIDTVGRPSPITPLMNPASRKVAAIRSRKGSNIAGAQISGIRERCRILLRDLRKAQGQQRIRGFAVPLLDLEFLILNLPRAPAGTSNRRQRHIDRSARPAQSGDNRTSLRI